MSSIKGRLLLTLFLLAFAVPTFAGEIDINFNTGGAPPAGVLSILTGGTNVTGTNIPIGDMDVLGTSAHDGSYPVTGGCLGYACMDFSTITGNIDIVGTVDGVTGTLLTGTIDSTWFLDHNGKTFDATGTDTKDPALLTALGIALFHPFGYFGSTTRFGPPIVGPSESYKATDTGIVNSTVTPEPASMLLMGTLLSLAGGVLSRKKRA